MVSLVWIAIAPFLIQNAFDFVFNFFERYKHLSRKEEVWQALLRSEAERFQSSKYLVFGLPWATITSGLVVFCGFSNAPFLIQIWAAFSFFILFLISSIGFFGVHVLLGMMRRVLPENIDFNPYHPDRFGGVSEFGRFSVKVSLYFSTGALVFPLAFEVVAKIGSEADFLYVPVYLLAGFFLSVMLASFIVPIFQIKNFVDPIKEEIILEARSELDRMMTEFRVSRDLDIKKGMEILMHFHFNYSKLLELKDYPWDLRVLFEYSLSFAIPVAVGIVQFALK